MITATESTKRKRCKNKNKNIRYFVNSKVNIKQKNEVDKRIILISIHGSEDYMPNLFFAKFVGKNCQKIVKTAFMKQFLETTMNCKDNAKN